MYKVLYFHGLNSSKEKSNTFKQLEKDTILSVDCYSMDYSKQNMMDLFIGKELNKYDVLFGNSFGAFFALYFGLKYKIPLVIANPSITPTKTILIKNNISTDIYKQLEKELDDLIEFGSMDDIPKTIILSSHDEVVDNTIIKNKTRLIVNSEVQMINGSHRLSKDAVDYIIKELIESADNICIGTGPDD